MNPRAVPCRVCQAGPGEPCKYKGSPISGALGGHHVRTSRSQRCYHHKRVMDAGTFGRTSR